ncbi:hypothetical protein [Desulfitobacterium hafniense]|uniref:Uncharacterized protein n=4 Tax=root TaxID=1 RepID=Q251H8_DESHY|nr:hypothetical protein [Desulfitobacterium hafniense]ACL18291.1 hypothetical protein Dhaf_0223 [Desulfitobacterium hafniense DCB-2]KTE92345.1 hypothetical protein AT727_20160 [Desulfitobacterium hafniense]MEA5024429.1 hypothetical protein [Desulfitobacterium hafniense]BAE82064.1 hypothetical protein DSY0275 [Desulfitobacterium hafniense Y51]
MNKKTSRFLLLMTLFLGLSLGIFFNAATTNAYPDMSEDGVTCTPCHEEGEHGGSGEPATEPEPAPPAPAPVQPTPSPQEPAQESPQVAKEQPDSADTTGAVSPALIVGVVVLLLLAVYLFAFKKHK